MKKYRIRKLSFIWWTTRIGGAVIGILGLYCWIWLALILTTID